MIKMARQTQMTRVASKGAQPRRRTRVLGAARLSVQRDASQTGIEKQDDAITDYVERNRLVLVELAKDENVSGGKSPFKRPTLSKWLTDPEYMAQYDTIVAATLDRLGRNARDLNDLRNWAEDNDKSLVVLNPALHWPPNSDDPMDVSGIIWDVLGRVAEIELKLITMRIRGTKENHRNQAKWSGGIPKLGYRAVCACHRNTECENPTGWKLARDDDKAKLVNQIADKFLAGESGKSIAQWLTSQRIPTGKLSKANAAERKRMREAGASPEEIKAFTDSHPNTNWDTAVVNHMMKAPTLYGVMVHYPQDENGQRLEYQAPEIVTDEDGEPVYFTKKPVLSEEKWNRLQDILTANAAKRENKNRFDVSLLSGVATCPCGLKLYANKTNFYAYYRPDGSDHEKIARCHHTTSTIVATDAEVDKWIASHSYPIRKRIQIGEDYTKRELDAIKAAMAKMTNDLNTGRRDFDDEYQTEYAGYARRQKELREAPPVEPEFEYRDTGKTVSGEWLKWDVPERRQFLIEMGFRIIVFRTIDEIGLLENAEEFFADPKKVTPIHAFCVCGKPGATKVGTCAGSAKLMRKSEGTTECQREYNRRNRLNYLARKESQPEPYNYDPDRIEVLMRPGPLYEADWFGIEVADRETYNMRMLAAERRGEVKPRYLHSAAARYESIIWSSQEDS